MTDKPDMTDLRKNEAFMKLQYNAYMNSDENLNDIADKIMKASKDGQSVTGKTIGNDFKAFGWSLKEPRRKSKVLDEDVVRNDQDNLSLLQKFALYSQIKLATGFGIPGSLKTVMSDKIDEIIFNDTEFKQVRDKARIITEKDAEIAGLKREVLKLQGMLNNLTSAFETIKSNKNPSGEKLDI